MLVSCYVIKNQEIGEQWLTHHQILAGNVIYIIMHGMHGWATTNCQFSAVLGAPNSEAMLAYSMS